jgi:lipopolysaccharide export LptBFGC system permease protein LptF
MPYQSEIVAMKANGISLYRTSLPLILLAGTICILAFLFSESITPFINLKADHILKLEVQKQRELGSLKQNQIWYRGKSGTITSKSFIRKPMLSGLLPLLYYNLILPEPKSPISPTMIR